MSMPLSTSGSLPVLYPSRILILLRAVLLYLIAFSATCFAAESFPQIEQLRLQPLAFTENHGQWKDDVLFRANGGGATLWFTKDGIYYQFTRTKNPQAVTPEALQKPQETPEFENLLVKTTFVGANPNPIARGEIMMEYKCNYFHGNDSTRWRTDVPNYESIVLSNVYDGIDLRFYGTGEKLEYDFIVAPGADYSQIQVQYDGAKSLAVDANGNLVVETEWGTMTELSPIVYQQQDGQRREIRGSYELIGENGFAFQLADSYDPSLSLFIDPVLTFSTYLGGTSSDYAYDVAVNASGEAFICGSTASANFPTVLYFDPFLDGPSDAFITKFNAAGNGVVYSTFLGGSSDEAAYALALYGDNAYLTGYTLSNNFPIVNPSLDGSANGSHDVFLAGLDPEGNSLMLGTYLGGSGLEIPEDLVLLCPSPCSTPLLRLWVVGYTTSTNFPTLNAYDATFNGDNDAFMVQFTLNSLGTLLFAYSTYLGGSSYDRASAISIAGTSTFTPYITGLTFSTDFPMVNPYDNSLSGPDDAFITSFGVAGNGELFAILSTYFGGASTDWGTAILTRSSGNICIAGETGSTGLATAGAYDVSYNGGGDAFVAEFNPTTPSLVLCTYLGGGGSEFAPPSGGLVQDISGNIFLTGNTSSADFPVADAYDASLGGSTDAFIAILNASGSELLFGSYLGGSNFDYGADIALDASSCMYVCGQTGSSNYPIVNPYDATLNNSDDAFLTKICIPLYVCGDADGSQGVDISDAVFLIAYIFSGGPAPNPLLSGDADCSGSVDISDAVYLLQYIFGGGPAPCASC